MLLIEEKEEDVLSHSTAVHLTTRTLEIKMTTHFLITNLSGNITRWATADAEQKEEKLSALDGLEMSSLGWARSSLSWTYGSILIKYSYNNKSESQVG